VETFFFTITIIEEENMFGQKKIGSIKYKSEHLVQFTGFNIGKHVEPFFFNILLNNVVFFKESELIFPTNLV
jgi:hypothetical protein